MIYKDPNPRPKIRAVHISDAHIDTDYKVGSFKECDRTICCREENGFPDDPSQQAG